MSRRNIFTIENHNNVKTVLGGVKYVNYDTKFKGFIDDIKKLLDKTRSNDEEISGPKLSDLPTFKEE